MLEHRLVWEWHNGPIPPGYEIHHRNKDRLDNRIENLELVHSKAHKREHHSTYVKAKKGWKKACTKCGRVYPLSMFHKNGKDGTLYGRCKPCDHAARRVRYLLMDDITRKGKPSA